MSLGNNVLLCLEEIKRSSLGHKFIPPGCEAVPPPPQMNSFPLSSNIPSNLFPAFHKFFFNNVDRYKLVNKIID